MTNQNIRTKEISTWCPGCFNFQILAGVEQFLKTKDLEKEPHAIASGIGCHAKIFDYLNLPGIYGIHGRVIPLCLGMKIANPSLNVIGFAGDGDAYDEGMAHLLHAARYNSDMTYIVHNNQVFALTVGQPTPTTEPGYKDKTTPFQAGTFLSPINPIALMLSAGCGFVARVYADVKQITEVLKQAEKHKGFKFIEIIQPCVIFHPDQGYKEKTYNLQATGHDSSNKEAAMKKALEFDYSSINTKTKIPLGIFYQSKEKTPIFEQEIRKKK